MALLVSSLPLSLTTIFGLPRSITSRSSSRTTRRPGERGVGRQRQTFAGAVVDHGQEAASVRELIRHEVERPAIVGHHRHRHRSPGPDRALAAATAVHCKLLFPVEPETFLVVDQIVFPLEQHMRPPIAEAAALLGDRPHALAKAGIVSAGRLISQWSCGSSRWLYTPAVRSSRMRLADGRQLPLGRGRHHFFPKRSFSAALSSMASARSRFSRVFSSSKAG